MQGLVIDSILKKETKDDFILTIFSFEYAKTVSIGLFTVYSAFGVALVASTGAYFDPNQMILSSKFYDIPFINWTFMVGHGKDFTILIWC